MKRVEKCVIVGLDALEYDLVESFQLKNLMQEEHGKIDLVDFDLLVTPTIWASFITGLPPSEHNVAFERMWENDRLEKLSHTLLGVILWQMRGIFYAFGYRRTHHLKKHFMKKGIQTLFEVVKDSIALDVPSYQEFISDEIRMGLHDAMKYGGGKEAEFETMAWKVFEDQKKTCLQRFGEGKWRLFMAYFGFTDYLGHLFKGDPEKMHKVYSVADTLVGELKSGTPDDILFLVVSDHGMKRFSEHSKYGEHSNHGFYSVNEKMGLQNPKMTDFFPIILKKLGIEFYDDKRDREKAIERLKKLGYF